MKSMALITTLLSAGILWAQVPMVDIYVAELKTSGDAISIGAPKNLTDREGYDNQPFFADNNHILYTSIREDGQSDIYRVNIKTGKSERITSTTESEYSPTLMPGGKEFSCIRVEADGSQRLWAFPVKGGEPRVLLTALKPVGYHTWLTDSDLGLFVLGEPHSLYFANTDQSATKVFPGIGRGLQKVPGEKTVSFIAAPANGSQSIQQMKLGSKKAEKIIDVLEGSQDFVWTKKGVILMAKDGVVHAFKPGSDKGWKVVADLSKQGLKTITRLAISPNGAHIALVASR